MQEVKLVTWNTQACLGLDGRADPARIVRTARALADFDLLCLQEVAVNFPALTAGVAQDQPALLRSLLPGFQVFFGAALDTFDAHGTRRRFGNLVATRLPVAQLRHHPLPAPPEPGVECTPRMCSAVTVRDATLGPVRIMTTHLEFYSRVQRLAQVHALLALQAEYGQRARQQAARAEAGSPAAAETHTASAILCGDFNAGPLSEEYAALTAPGADGLHDAWTLAQPDRPHVATFSVHEQRYLPAPLACDFCFVTADLRHRVRQVRVDSATRASDHQPLLLDLR